MADSPTKKFTLPVIGKSQSANAGHRGTMASLFSDLISDEEILESQTPKEVASKKLFSPDTTEAKGIIVDTKAEKKHPSPPESPVPSRTFERTRTYSVDKLRNNVLSNVSQMTACLAIDVGLVNLKTISNVSQMAAQSAIDIGLAKMKSDDMSNDYTIGTPGTVEAVLATTITTIALENALKKIAGLKSTSRSQ